MQDYFHRIVDELHALIRGNEVFLSSFAGESSDFVRFNRGEIRQAGSVVQRYLTVDLIEGRRHASTEISLAGDLETDRPRLTHIVEELRATRPFLAEDPFLLYAQSSSTSERVLRGEIPDGPAAAAAVQDMAGQRDLVGIYAAGDIGSGFASSLGQRNWHATESFHLDWSLYHRDDRAVKTSYAGFVFSAEELERKARLANQQLAALARPSRTIRPGRYRVYLAPAALQELVSLLAWGGFGLRALRTKTTPLIRMAEEGATLHSSLRVSESIGDGMAPNFQEAGFVRPDDVPLIRDGRFDGCLVSPRSAAEYGVETNGASSSEMPHSLELGPGDVPHEKVLELLGTGLYVSNLWYLNFSDRSACRTTGMTRFATFWVENGAIADPVNVMRFDETVYRVLGENLVGLTDQTELILDAGTYGKRSTESSRLPGALVEDFTLTL